ncbi:MAG: radical SAM protein [Treponema sp.]
MRNDICRLSFFNDIYEIDDTTAVIINYASGAIDALPISQLMPVLKQPDSTTALNRYLQQRGYITQYTKAQEIEKRNSYAQQLLSLDDKIRRNPHFVFIPSYNCNLGCAYCFVCGHKQTDTITAARKIRNRSFTPQILAAAFQFIEKRRGKTSSISFFGGEPFLPRHKPVIEKITAYAVSRKMPLSAITNGTELSYFIEILSHFSNLQITLDGPAAIHNKSRPYKSGAPSFDRIIANLALLMQYTNVSVQLRCNLDKRSIQQYEMMAEELSSYSWFDKERISIYGSPIVDNDGVFPHIFTSSQEFLEAAKSCICNPNRLLQLMERFAFSITSLPAAGREPPQAFLRPSAHFCSSETATAILSPDGYLYACLELVANPQYSIGTFYPDITVTEMQDSWHNRSIVTLEPCRTCKYALVCSGGCASKSLHKNGTMYKVNCADYPYIMREYSRLYYRTKVRNADE